MGLGWGAMECIMPMVNHHKAGKTSFCVCVCLCQDHKAYVPDQHDSHYQNPSLFLFIFWHKFKKNDTKWMASHGVTLVT